MPSTGIGLRWPCPRRDGRYGGEEVQIHSLVTSALATGERSTSRSGRFIPRKGIVRYTWDTRMGEPQSRSGRCGGEKSLASVGISWQPSHNADLNPVHNFRPCLRSNDTLSFQKVFSKENRAQVCLARSFLYDPLYHPFIWSSLITSDVERKLGNASSYTFSSTWCSS